MNFGREKYMKDKNQVASY